MVIQGIFIKFSACGVHFYKNLQFMMMKVCCRQKNFSLQLKFWKFPMQLLVSVEACLHHMQKTNFITQLILEIKLTHYSGHILAVSCLRQSHTWDCPFLKYFQILYILPKFSSILPFFALFLKSCAHVLMFCIIKYTKAAVTLFS